MLTTEECPEMNVGTGKFSDDHDVEMTVGALHWQCIQGASSRLEEAAAGKARLPTVEILTDGTMRLSQ